MNPSLPNLSPPWWRRLLAASMSAALVAGLLVAFTGGPGSPWIGLFYVALVPAGFTSVGMSLMAAAWISVVYAISVVFSPGSIPQPSILAAQIASFFGAALVLGLMAWRRDLLHRSLNRAAAEARYAMDVQHMINAAYDIDMTLDLVLLKQREIARADSYAVLLVDKNNLIVRASSGLGSEDAGARLGVNDDDQGWHPADGPLAIADTRAAATRLSALDPDARSILVVPLHSVERLVGLLFFGSRQVNAFSTHDVDTVDTFATQVVFPIQRAMLEDDLRRLAFTDSQTSLFNHRHFQTQLDEEVHRAQRYGRPVSVILLDIDGFKEFNDTFGHPAGDRLLKDLSGILRDGLRTVDIPARYGGEEFVVICPETTGEQALILADRVRHEVESTEFSLDDGEAHHLTVSVGVAAFPSDAHNKTELVDAADKALYEAKRTGKNRAVIYHPSF